MKEFKNATRTLSNVTGISREHRTVVHHNHTLALSTQLNVPSIDFKDNFPCGSGCNIISEEEQNAVANNTAQEKVAEESKDEPNDNDIEKHIDPWV